MRTRMLMILVFLALLGAAGGSGTGRAVAQSCWWEHYGESECITICEGGQPPQPGPPPPNPPPCPVTTEVLRPFRDENRTAFFAIIQTVSRDGNTLRTETREVSCFSPDVRNLCVDENGQPIFSMSALAAAPARVRPQRVVPTPVLRSDALRSVPGAECLPPDRPVEAARLVRVIDGDTIEVRIGGRRVVVRYIGVNAPERGQPFYARATAANWRRVAGSPLYLIRDVSETDRHGRLLRYVIAGGIFVNLALAREGYARAMTVPPDVSCAEAFRAAETEARRAGRGLWGGPAQGEGTGGGLGGREYPSGPSAAP
ncbi:thermonuclease family protein [Thermoflexus sp.]|uniref:thermonuclease family protein n=1 Tax=Thermoflexus sp. TaxID=1969742 RepID=UPI002ADE8B6E|nr:thermonuclease family protein [Thermoflexus sp.]